MSIGGIKFQERADAFMSHLEEALCTVYIGRTYILM